MSGAGTIVLGNVGFGPAQSLWEEQPTLRELYDQACASIVRAECEIEELGAEVALLKQGMVMLAQERDEARFAARAGMTTEEMREDFLKEWRRDQ